jgi:hypothetical protein
VFVKARASCVVLLTMGHGAKAGLPCISDDPGPTDYGHFEIYAFADGAVTHDGAGGESGVDFNYGAAPDLQLTAVLPLAYVSLFPRIFSARRVACGG